jgi:hypothetical protein
VARVAGFESQCDRKLSLPSPGRAEEDNIVSQIDETEACQVEQDLRTEVWKLKSKFSRLLLRLGK